MILEVIGSSSQGNCYLLHTDTETLIIEAGVHVKEIKQALDFDFRKVVGCIVSHSHGDHAKSIDDIAKLGVKVYSGEDTIKRSHNKRIIKHLQFYEIGEFKVMPFNVPHGVQNFGFIISHKSVGNIFFATDANYINYMFSNINHYMIEANFDQAKLDENVESGKLPNVVRKQVMVSHMSLQTCKEFLSANDLFKADKIILLHISVGNLDPDKALKEIKELTKKKVFIAVKGLKIEL